LLVACSSKAEDGASCESASDCTSGTCTSGACEGADCTCDTADCRTRSACQAGWLCTRGDVGSDIITRCRKECTDTSSCPANKHCDDGVCRAGPEPFALSWVNIPRTSPCAANVPCEYKVRASAGVNVDAYTWTFGGTPSINTHDPTTSFTYEKSGTYEVLVHAHSDNGATAELHTTEALCQGAVGDTCETNVTLCCQGTCVADLCK
jgi:hypothetical protein